MFSVISNAFAQTADTVADAGNQVAASSAFSSMIPLVAIIGIFYFLIIRPQQKKLREHQKMITSLTRGDKVIIGGGILGKITKVEEDVVSVEIAPEVNVSVKRQTVTEVLNRLPGNDNANAKKDDKKDKKAS